jgi:hypothetical protein
MEYWSKEYLLPVILDLHVQQINAAYLQAAMSSQTLTFLNFPAIPFVLQTFTRADKSLLTFLLYTLFESRGILKKSTLCLGLVFYISFL